MTINHITIQGYRSLPDLQLPLQHVNVIVGPNGCGKSNLYRALYLLAQSANGLLSRTLAEEGGMPSVLWAGPRKGKGAIRMRIGIELDEYDYELNCGIAKPDNSAFDRDPEVKEEWVRLTGHTKRSKKAIMMEKQGLYAALRDTEGVLVEYPLMFDLNETALSQIREPQRYPELSYLRMVLQQWRFYHHFRTDIDSPIRRPQVAIRTPVLFHDGRDLASALQTIIEVGNEPVLTELLAAAFPKSKLYIDQNYGLTVGLQMPGLLRPLNAAELSDGTLRYLCLLAALLTPRPPAFIALNEPETSLHPDLIEPLARLIAKASENSQILITTHSKELATYIQNVTGEKPIQLKMKDGETQVAR